jgi:hypothetical protein
MYMRRQYEKELLFSFSVWKLKRGFSLLLQIFISKYLHINNYFDFFFITISISLHLCILCRFSFKRNSINLFLLELNISFLLLVLNCDVHM